MHSKTSQLACIAHKSLEICERCRLRQWNPPATPENSAAFLKRRVSNNLFRFLLLKQALRKTRNSRSQKLQEFRSCRMGRRLSGLRMVIHTLPCDKEFDSASSRFDRTYSRP